MSSLENFKKTLNNNFAEAEERGENEDSLPLNAPGKVESHEEGENFETIEKSEKIPTSESVKELISRKVREIILYLKGKIEERTDVSFERVVGKGILAFAIASALTSYPQFDAMAAEKGNIQSESSLDGATKKNEPSDEAVRMLNEEFAEFAEADLERRKMEMATGDFDGNLYSESYESYLREKANPRTGQLMQKLGETFDDKGKPVESNIDLLPEGGVMVSFKGGMENVGDIPEAFRANIKEIKNNPLKYMAGQLLDMFVVSDVKKNANEFLNEHTQDIGADFYR